MTEARVDAEERREWNRLSHVIATIANAFGDTSTQPKDCNPYRQTRTMAPSAKEHVSLLAVALKDIEESE